MYHCPEGDCQWGEDGFLPGLECTADSKTRLLLDIMGCPSRHLSLSATQPTHLSSIKTNKTQGQKYRVPRAFNNSWYTAYYTPGTVSEVLYMYLFSPYNNEAGIIIYGIDPLGPVTSSLEH